MKIVAQRILCRIPNIESIDSLKNRNIFGMKKTKYTPYCSGSISSIVEYLGIGFIIDVRYSDGLNEL